MKKILASYTLGIISFKIIILFVLFIKLGTDKEILIMKIKELILAFGALSLSIYVFMPFLILIPIGIVKLISKTSLFDRIVEYIKSIEPKEKHPELLTKFILSYLLPVTLLSLITSISAGFGISLYFFSGFILSGLIIWNLDRYNKRWFENIFSLIGLLCFMVSMYIFIFMPNFVLFLLEIL